MTNPVRAFCRGWPGLAGLLAGLAMACGTALAAEPGTLESTQPCCGPISPAGQTVARLLDDSGVDHLWLAHQHVNWESGVQDRAADTAGLGRATHCSAYVAAMGKRLGVYMLRPPGPLRHAAGQCANALVFECRWQAAWMGSNRQRAGGAKPRQCRRPGGHLLCQPQPPQARPYRHRAPLAQDARAVGSRRPADRAGRLHQQPGLEHQAGLFTSP